MKRMGTTYLQSQVFCGAGVILEKDGKILLIKEHRPGKPDHGTWNFPCGFLDLGEDPYEAAIRETREEAGYDTKPYALLGVYSNVREDLLKGTNMPHGIFIYYIGVPLNDEAYEHDHEVSEIRWITPDELLLFSDESIRGGANRKKIIQDYKNGKRYPLEVVQHMVKL